jgi:hypothetical protein
MEINPQPGIGDSLRPYVPVILVGFLIALIANFAIFFFYNQNLTENNRLLKTCDLQKLCKSVIPGLGGI